MQKKYYKEIAGIKNNLTEMWYTATEDAKKYEFNSKEANIIRYFRDSLWVAMQSLNAATNIILDSNIKLPDEECDENEEEDYEGISAFDGDDWEEPSDEHIREFNERMMWGE